MLTRQGLLFDIYHLPKFLRLFDQDERYINSCSYTFVSLTKISFEEHLRPFEGKSFIDQAEEVNNRIAFIMKNVSISIQF